MSKQKAAFLDLQGTLGGKGLGDIIDFSFYPFSPLAIKLLNEANLLVIVLTNQSHIAKGHFTYDRFEKRVEEIKEKLAEQGAKLDVVYCCPHASDSDCSCRKPSPGLVIQAQRDFDLDLLQSYLVGDTGAWDMVLARSVGCKAILVRTGLGEDSLGEYRHMWKDIEPDFIAENVLDAAKWIVGLEQKSRFQPRTG